MSDLFNYCCDNPAKEKYSILHNPIPLKMMPELQFSIERFLWYVPGIDSKQSYKHFLIDDVLYSEAAVEVLWQSLNINRNTDIKISIPTEEDIKYYKEEICINCQKIIISKMSNETIIRAFLRHIRNSIAHGYFVPKGDKVIFLDEARNRKTKKKYISAIIKLDVIKLDNALRELEDFKGLSKEKIIKRLFELLGYNVLYNYKDESGIFADMLIEDEQSKYVIEIKDSPEGIKMIRNMLAHEQIPEFYKFYIDHEFIPVLICDSIKADKDHLNLISKMGIIVLDQTRLSQIKKGKKLVDDYIKKSV